MLCIIKYSYLQYKLIIMLAMITSTIEQCHNYIYRYDDLYQ